MRRFLPAPNVGARRGGVTTQARQVQPGREPASAQPVYVDAALRDGLHLLRRAGPPGRAPLSVVEDHGAITAAIAFKGLGRRVPDHLRKREPITRFDGGGRPLTVGLPRARPRRASLHPKAIAAVDISSCSRRDRPAKRSPVRAQQGQVWRRLRFSVSRHGSSCSRCLSPLSFKPIKEQIALISPDRLGVSARRLPEVPVQATLEPSR